MRFGVNYTPKKDWFHTWLNPDLESMKDDFESIKGIGLDHIRMFHLWPLLQPNRTMINKKAVDDFAKAVKLAGECGLDVFVDILQGHLSSFDFVPSWLYSWHEGNMFTDELAVQAEQKLISTIWNELKTLENFKGLTVGNEVNQFSYSGHPCPMMINQKEAFDWTNKMLSAVEDDKYRKDKIVVHSCYDASWIYKDHPFTTKMVSTLGDMTNVHAWIFNDTAQTYGGNSYESYHHAEYSIELFRAFSEPKRVTWLQEIGAPLNVLDKKFAQQFCEVSVESAIDTQDFWGITWWCSHDVSRSLADFPELEYDLGLFDNCGKLKPVGETFSEMAKKYKNISSNNTYKDGTVLSNAKPRENAIVVQVDNNGDMWDRGRFAPGKDLFDKWMQASKDGLRPTFINSIVAQDNAQLAKRGIKNLI